MKLSHLEKRVAFLRSCVASGDPDQDNIKELKNLEIQLAKRLRAAHLDRKYKEEKENAN